MGDQGNKQKACNSLMQSYYNYFFQFSCKLYDDRIIKKKKMIIKFEKRKRKGLKNVTQILFPHVLGALLLTWCK